MSTVAVSSQARELGAITFWFGADALVTGVNAVAYLVLAVPLVEVLGANSGTHRAVGALLALPAAAVIQALASTYVARHEVIETAMTAEPRPKRGLLSFVLGRRSSADSTEDMTKNSGRAVDSPPDV